MFGGMHRLHEISDKEKLYNRLVRGLRNDECKVENIRLEHEKGCIPMLSCELEMPYRDDAADSVSYHYYARGHGRSIDDLWPKLDLMKKRDGEKIKKVIFNDPVTVVLWLDGTKTIVKCEDEDFDPEKGLAMAIAKKYLGTNKTGSNYYDTFKKWIPEDRVKTEITSEGITFTFDNDEIRKSIDRAFKIPPLTFFGRGE